MRSKKFLTCILLILPFIFFAQSRFTFGQSRPGTILIENNTKATLTIYIQNYRYGNPRVAWDEVSREIPPMKTTRLENFLPRGRIGVIAIAKRAPKRKYRDENGNFVEEYYSAEEIFWVSGEATKVHKWVLTPELFGALDLEDQEERIVGGEKKIIDLTGTWKSKGGTYEIKQVGNEITWFGKGKYNGQYWEHNGRAVISGNKLDGSFKDTENSSWPGNSRAIKGTISEDGNTLKWPTLNKFEREWKRQ